MDTLDQNPYSWPVARKSLRSIGLPPSGSPSCSPSKSPSKKHHESMESGRGDTEDISEDESDSFEYSLENVSMNSTKSADGLRKFIHSETETVTKRRVTTGRLNDSINSRNDDVKSAEGKVQADRTSLNIAIGTCVLIVIMAVAFFYVYQSQSGHKRIECPQFKELSKQFIHQDKILWKSLKVGIENMLNGNPAQPSVFLLAHNDPKTSKNMMAHILNATANCMQSHEPIQLDGGSFATDAMLQDYGEFIVAYRERLEHEGIMYVADLQETSSQAAQAFHTICDTVTPFVERSVIFFTLYVNQLDRSMSSVDIHKLVEAELERKWGDINRNTLQALIGRVTDQVFLLHSEV